MKEKEEETVVSIIGRREKKVKSNFMLFGTMEKKNGAIKNH